MASTASRSLLPPQQGHKTWPHGPAPVYWKQRGPFEGAGWRPLCAATFARPLALPLNLTIAPRWNPHALIATCGPLLIRGRLAFHLETVEKAAGYWSCVVYQFPNNHTRVRIGALDGPFPAPWVSVPLAALVIISFTPVRSLGDCVGLAYALRYEGIASHVFRAWLVSPSRTCSLNRDLPNTVGFTPHICKQDRDVPWFPLQHVLIWGILPGFGCDGMIRSDEVHDRIWNRRF